MADHSSRSCPYDHASVFSKITFWWMNALFRLGSKDHLTSVNICDVSKDDESSLLGSRLERCWKEEVQKYSEGQKASLFCAVLRAFRWQWILPGFLVLCFESIKLVQPYLISLLVSYFNDKADAVPQGTAYGIGACLGLSAVLQICLNPIYFFIMQHVALRMKVAVGALIYRKVLSLRYEALQYTSAGQIVNHLSTDIEKFNPSIDLLHYFWVSPLSIAVMMYLMYRQVGVICFWSLAVIVVIISAQAGLSTVFGKLRERIGAYSDRRIQLISEAILGMKIIKMQCWEQPFQTLVSNLRRLEIRLYIFGAAVKGINFGTEEVCARVVMLTLVMAFYFTMDLSLEPYTAFFILSMLDAVRLTGFFFPHFAAETLSQLKASLQRVQAFLLLDEEKEQIKELRLHRSISYCSEPHKDWAIDIDHMTARWPLVYTEGRRRFQKKKLRSSTSSTKSLLHESDVDHAFSLKYISLQVKKGELLAVVGVVGSGKSTLLMCLIGELSHEIGQISINGRVSYYGQTSWVFGGTVKDNILFGQAFNESRYHQVIEACGLTQDLKLLPKGDQTFVGERGLQLSGGQKARLSLARCVYHDADIFLFDDPLSAVDATVGQHIFQRCIKDLLKEKTVLLVTHQLQYLKQSDRIVVLRDGSIYDVGTYDELKSRGIDLRALTTSYEHPKYVTEAAREAEEEETKLHLESKYLELNADYDSEEEEIQTGSVGFRVFWEYFCAGFGPALLPVLLPLWIAGPALFCLSDWMLSEWLSQNVQHQRHNGTSQIPHSVIDQTSSSMPDAASDHMPTTLRVYIAALASSLVAHILYSIIFFKMAAKAGQRLHDRMLKCVMNAISRFFDTHSIGQVLNRFSRDLGFIDDTVSVLAYVVSLKTTQFLGFFLVTVTVNPWLILAVVPVIVSIVLIRMFSLRTMRQVKRLEARARSPVYSHLSDTILGLETIRALGKRDQFLTEFDDHQNSHTAAWFLHLSSYRWMSVRCLGAVVLYLNIIIFISLILKDSLDGNLLALSLIYCISMSEPFEFYVRASADLETYMTSVERVLAYCRLEQEPPKTSNKPPSPNWPNRGAITFTNVSLKYSEDAPWTLKNIECHIKGKEKIGIVGRTGSGKSSLMASLFQLARTTGLIFIDGVDIGKLGLHELRSKISVIPQDPILFSQTLRWNLDPLNEFSDERLWNALEQVQLKNKVELMPAKLYTEIQERGTNLSVGQMQLICVARAILKYNKILILDEATANVDQETDDIIQRTLRAKFRESTVLTIAHRLYTVMDCDRIMVLEDGELKEFDTPYNLLQNSDGIFTRLVLSMGKSQAKQLQALAELSQHQRASASLQLHRAMLLANEQLAQSTDDLRAGRKSLNWNRFTHSQDSLEKIQVENIIEKEKKAVAPSQKIIRRRSPGGAVKRTVDEEDRLLNRDVPRKTHLDSDVSFKNELNKKEQLPVAHGNRSQGDGGRHRFLERNENEYERWDTEVPNASQRESRRPYSDQRERETNIDASNKPLLKNSPNLSGKNLTESKQYSQQKGQRIHSSPRSVSNSRASPASTRVLSSNFVPLALRDDEKEEFV